jgi:N-sulfoglucosamine sulfohydrolase
VLFVSEQGSSMPFAGKWSLYDTGIRASAFARWPGIIKPGSVSDALLQYVDVVPTLLEMAGVDSTKVDTGCPDANGARGFDGRSFLPVLRGETNRQRDFVFAQHTTVSDSSSPIRSARRATPATSSSATLRRRIFTG